MAAPTRLNKEYDGGAVSAEASDKPNENALILRNSVIKGYQTFQIRPPFTIPPTIYMLNLNTLISMTFVLVWCGYHHFTDEKHQLKLEDIAGLPIGHVPLTLLGYFRSVLEDGCVFADVTGDPIPSFSPWPEKDGESREIDETSHQCLGDDLQVPNSSSNATELNYGVVTITCNGGYGGIGDEFYTCVNDTWVGDYECRRFCEVIDMLENGKIVNNPSYFAGSWIVFECNEGYTMIGDSRLLCRTDGKWRPSDPPTCKIKSCGEFGNVQNGETFQATADGTRNVYGNKITVTCDLGYVRSGPSEVYCRADGTWGPEPVCQLSSCGSHPGSNSSCIEQTGMTEDGSMITHLCLSESGDISVTKNGSGIAICINNEWDEPYTGCYCDCKIEANFTEVKVTNLVNDKFLKHGEKLTWECKAGYRKENIADIFCNDGRYDSPKCVQIPTSTVTHPIPSPTNPTQKPLTERGSSDTSTLGEKGQEEEPSTLVWLIPVILVTVGAGIGTGVFLWKRMNSKKSENPESNANEENPAEKVEMLPKSNDLGNNHS